MTCFMFSGRPEVNGFHCVHCMTWKYVHVYSTLARLVVKEETKENPDSTYPTKTKQTGTRTPGCPAFELGWWVTCICYKIVKNFSLNYSVGFIDAFIIVYVLYIEQVCHRTYIHTCTFMYVYRYIVGMCKCVS